MKDLAQKHKCTTGKWLMPVEDGKFSDELGVYFIRTFGRETPSKNPHCFHKGQRKNGTMISIHTKDWTDEETTLKIAEVARGLSLKDELHYKADAYTALGIYRNNVYNIIPTIYRLY